MKRNFNTVLTLCLLLVLFSCKKEDPIQPLVPDVALNGEPQISGVVDCNGNAGGDSVKLFYRNGSLIEAKKTNPGGGFNFTVPVNTSLTLEVKLFDGSKDTTIDVTSGALGTAVSLGNIRLCDSYFFTKIAAGGKHCMALRSDGTIWAWGDNSQGQLGRDSLNQAPLLFTAVPVQVGSESGWIKIAAGHYYSLAIKFDGTLWAWGQDNKGQLGNGAASAADVREPVQIGSDSWLEIAAGIEHSLALRSDGTVWSWGDNEYGQLGLGSLTPTIKKSPTQVGTANDWTFVTAKGANSGAIKSNGSLWLWGNNERGQTCVYNRPPCTLIQSDTIPITSPTREITNSTWLTASAGSCMIGINTANELLGGGDNVNGQLNQVVIDVINVNTDPLGPCNFYFKAIQLTPISGWIKTSFGHGPYWVTNPNNQRNGHTMALRFDGSLWTAGNNLFGHLGNGGYYNQLLTRVGMDNDWKDIDAGAGTSLMLKLDGSVWAMGRNDRGQVGTGVTSTVGIPNPTRVLFN